MFCIRKWYWFSITKAELFINFSFFNVVTDNLKQSSNPLSKMDYCYNWYIFDRRPRGVVVPSTFKVHVNLENKKKAGIVWTQRLFRCRRDPSYSLYSRKITAILKSIVYLRTQHTQILGLFMVYFIRLKFKNLLHKFLNCLYLEKTDHEKFRIPYYRKLTRIAFYRINFVTRWHVYDTL